MPIPCGTGVATHNLTVPPDTAIRIRTILGKRPRTASTTIANARLGACGDLGFEATDCKADDFVNSPPYIVVGGARVSERIVEAATVRDKGGIRVTFRTTAELSVTGIDILGRSDSAIASVPCRQCTTGLGDTYEVHLGSKVLKGAKQIRLRLNGPGHLTDPVDVR